MTALLVLALVAGAVVLWVRWQEPRSLYFPERQHGAYLLPDGFTPEDVHLESEDGTALHGWFSRADTKASPGGGLTVLYLHGNAGNLANRIDKIRLLNRLGADVFIIDYRGYGLSDGRPSEQGVYRDARAAYQHLIDRRGIDPARLVILGESLGSAIAVELACGVAAGGVVLEAVFTSAVDVAQASYPFLPMRYLMTQHFDSVTKIVDVRAPIMILHSRDDEYFPMHHPERLMAAARTATRLVEMRGSHDGASIESADIYREAMAPFFEAVKGESE